MGGPCLVDGTMRPELDNFLQCAFELDGKQWTSSEQYFQAVKFTDEGYREKIRACHDGGACWQLGNSRAFQLRADWENVKVDVMIERLRDESNSHRKSPELVKSLEERE